MPKFPDILLNNNPDAPSVDLNDLQVKGVGIFADATERDALNSNLHTEGYLAIMKDTNTVFVYLGGTWTDAANWQEAKGVWEEVSHTNDTAIKYENGVVGIKDSAVTYPTSGNLWSKVKSFPLDRDAIQQVNYVTDALMHLHEGRIVFTTENTTTNFNAITITNAFHGNAYDMSIGMESNYGTITGTSGIRMKPSGVSMMAFGYGSTGTTPHEITVGNNMPVQGASTNRMGVNFKQSVLMLSGEILFYGHTANVFSAIKPRGFYSTTSGVSIASPRSGYFAHFAASDGNTIGSYGYLGINVDNPTPTGPAFEVSSSYAKFNNGLHIGDITATGYAFPTATGTTGQILKVDANGDLVFGDDLNGLWTSDTNGITYAGHVGIDIASDVSFPLTVGGGAKIGGKLAMFSDAAHTAGNVMISHGNFTVNPSATSNNILIGGQVTATTSNSIIIGYNVTGSGQDLILGSSTYHTRAVIGSNPNNIGGGSVGIYKAAASSYAVAIGQASNANVSGGVAIGLQAMSGDGVAIGNRAGTANTSTNVGNVNIGVNAGHRYYNVGGQDFNNTVNIGYEAGRSMAYNTSITGNSVNIGYQTGYFAEGGNNVMIGYRAGYGVDGTSTGSGNVFLGNSAGYNETGSDKLYIANSNTTTPLIYGEFDNDLCRVNGNFQRVVFGSTETTTSGTIHIRDNTDWSTQADATNNTASTGLLGIALGATADVGLVLFGDVDYTITGNVGTPVYLDTTAGGFTTTAPTGSGNIVRVMGHIIGSNKIFFNPSNDWLEIV